MAASNPTPLPPARGVPARPTPITGKGVMPTASVGSFTNRGQVGALTSGLPGTQSQQLSPTQTALDLAGKKQSAVQLSASNRMTKIQESNQRLNVIAKQAAAKRAAQQSAGKPNLAQQGSVGRAYTPDGRLSAPRNKALSLASQYMGAKYVLGGTSTQGIDCSGLVMMVYNQLGYNISRHSAQWQGNNIPGVRTSISNLRPGDIVAWKDGSHIAIYAGNGEIIESAYGYGGRRAKLYTDDVYGIALRMPGE